MNQFIRLFLITSVSLLTAFSTTAHDADVSFDPVNIIPPSKPLTHLGKNRQPIFVNDNSFIYISKDRRYHKDPQIYFKDLRSGREKRVTHQRGHIINGAWVDKESKIIFASTTDEEKETPAILEKYLERYPSSVKNDFFFHINMSPSEIYSSKIDGSEIKRLSKHSGFDAFPSYLKKKDRLYFSRWDQGRINIFAQSTKKELKPWRVLKTQGHDLGLQLSPHQDRFVWYRFSPDFKSSQLMFTNTDFKDPHFLTLDSGISWSPSWHPNNDTILYSAKVDGSKEFDIYEVSVGQGCKRQITSYEGDEFYPVVSPDGSKLLFTSTQEGQEQIHEVSYPEPFRCDSTKAQ